MNTPSTLLRASAREIATETVRVLRDPAFVAPAVGFPVAFYLLFTLVLPMGGNSPQAARVLFANYCAFGVLGAMLFGGALLLSSDRDHGVLKLKRATPLPMPVFFVAKLVAGLVLATLVFATMAAVAVGVVGVRFEAAQWLALGGAMFAGALASGAIGLAIGAWARATTAPGVVNLVFLPMAALGGLWFPMRMMPTAVQQGAHVLPTFHFGELARSAIGLPAQADWISLAALAVFVAIGALAALQGLRRKPF
jgi:ABC-2 type transport system permease protein